MRNILGSTSTRVCPEQDPEDCTIASVTDPSFEPKRALHVDETSLIPNITNYQQVLPGKLPVATKSRVAGQRLEFVGLALTAGGLAVARGTMLRGFFTALTTVQPQPPYITG